MVFPSCFNGFSLFLKWTWVVFHCRMDSQMLTDLRARSRGDLIQASGAEDTENDQLTRTNKWVQTLRTNNSTYSASSIKSWELVFWAWHLTHWDSVYINIPVSLHVFHIKPPGCGVWGRAINPRVICGVLKNSCLLLLVRSFYTLTTSHPLPLIPLEL